MGPERIETSENSFLADHALGEGNGVDVKGEEVASSSGPDKFAINTLGSVKRGKTRSSALLPNRGAKAAERRAQLWSETEAFRAVAQGFHLNKEGGGQEKELERNASGSVSTLQSKKQEESQKTERANSPHRSGSCKKNPTDKKGRRV